MKEDIIHKILKVNRTSPRSLSIQIHGITQFHSYEIEFRNVYSTDISSIKSSYKNLFFEYFPYQNIKTHESYDLLPPRVFFDSTDNPIKYLLTENSEIPTQEFCPFLGFLKNLKFSGRLKQKKDKSVYLEIDDFYINLISQSLEDNRIKKSNNYKIAIISKDEYELHEVFPIEEIDEKFDFQIKGMYSVNLTHENDVKKLWYLEVESQDLEDFRYKHHLFPKIKGYNFSIILGFISFFKLRKSFPIMKINITFIAA